MGGDGGTLAVKRSFLRKDEGTARDRAKAEKQAATELRVLSHRTCSISGEELQEPVVCCELGYLYNKEALLQRLLEGPPLEDKFKHVKFKELLNCVLEANPTFTSEGKKKSTSSVASSNKAASTTMTFWAEPDAPAPFICPVTLLEMNGKFPFCCLYPSGRVLSSKAITEVPKIMEGDTRIIKINPSEEERTKAYEDLLERRKKNKKQDRKRKKGKGKDEDSLSKKAKADRLQSSS
mmetsp:Transcript_10188/g.19955  ORF Transcript_10188/g.19955 Transcript_10188/m.19955 type:complete len:236 (+) Transcript_10188:130-837(+)|eukprot:CAMPEP_0171499422 /NCGR_PEP_ID=MMETSP0958-20121227/8425_1 /TAXON_ID=87120 /ORGANISM="Aurantiochytrium limacinum, Strain ATCCMYA-1381" /LENGTH=235 /DNA_ID=CAMNT_0012033987 /DNA_START=44 /DNA_END=751 /DNA_ORIENTATION=+